MFVTTILVRIAISFPLFCNFNKKNLFIFLKPFDKGFNWRDKIALFSYRNLKSFHISISIEK